MNTEIKICKCGVETISPRHTQCWACKINADYDFYGKDF